MLAYHPAPLSQRMPIQGRIPMTSYEWLHTPLGYRNSSQVDEPNPFILLTENTGTTIIPVVIVGADQIKVYAHA